MGKIHPLNSLRRSGAMGVALFALLSMVGCQSLPAKEFETFTPMAIEKRRMDEVKVRWLVRDDVAQYCAKGMNMSQEQAFLTPPVACAMWSVAAKECTVITGSKTTHTALGHELRHCFEGHFHPKTGS